MGEERFRLLGIVQTDERGPEIAAFLRQALGPGFMPRFDRLKIGALGEIRWLDREAGGSDRDFEAGIPGPEVQAERMKDREIGDDRLVRETASRMAELRWAVSSVTRRSDRGRKT